LFKYWSVFDVSEKEKEIFSIEQNAGESQFWDDPQRAQTIMQRLSRLKEIVTTWRGLELQGNSLLDLVELSIDDGDESLEEQIREELEGYRKTFESNELSLTLSGPYDSRPALLSVFAGAGGVDSQDWSQMLLRMYLRWSERHKYEARILDIDQSDEAGIKHATVQITGELAYGYLKAEKGVHRLVRLSPFNSDHLRHTSFARVEVLPVAESQDPEVEIRSDDIKLDFIRSSGPGGQNVNKVASAVRITHIPSGIVVACQTERSQHQNREHAMTILRARILEYKIKKREQEVAALKGDTISAEWGNQIRSYVLHPYKLVKDHRTDYQSNDAEKVLDGDINEFLNAYLVSMVGS